MLALCVLLAAGNLFSNSTHRRRVQRTHAVTRQNCRLRRWPRDSVRDSRCCSARLRRTRNSRRPVLATCSPAEYVLTHPTATTGPMCAAGSMQQPAAKSLAAAAILLTLAGCKVPTVQAADPYDPDHILTYDGSIIDARTCEEMNTTSLTKTFRNVSQCALFCEQQTTRRPYYFQWNQGKHRCKCNRKDKLSCRCTHPRDGNAESTVYRVRAPGPLPWAYDKIADGAMCEESKNGPMGYKNSADACAKWWRQVQPDASKRAHPRTHARGEVRRQDGGPPCDLSIQQQE